MHTHVCSEICTEILQVCTKGKIYFYYVKYLKYCLRKNNKCVSQYGKSSQIILKLMAIANVADLLRKKCPISLFSTTIRKIFTNYSKTDGHCECSWFFYVKTPMHTHVCNKIRKELCKCAQKGKFISIFCSIWQYQFSFRTCFHQVRVPPLPPPDPCIYLYCYTTRSGSALSHCELGGGGVKGKGATRQPGVVHILGLLFIITIQQNSNK